MVAECNHFYLRLIYLGQAARGIDPTVVEKSFKQSEAIIHSMTLRERRDPDILNASRRRLRHGSAGRKPPDQAVPRGAEDDEDDPKNWGKRFGKDVWVNLEKRVRRTLLTR